MLSQRATNAHLRQNPKLLVHLAGVAVFFDPDSARQHQGGGTLEATVQALWELGMG